LLFKQHRKNQVTKELWLKGQSFFVSYKKGFVMTNIGLLKRTETALLIIDLQEKLMPVINNSAEVFSNVNKLIVGAEILSVPIIITEQYSKGLGHTCSEVQLPNSPLIIEKMCFSSMLSNEVVNKLQELKVKSLIIAGVEAHVCVLKTALDALSQSFEIHIVADAVSSRKAYDKQVALERLRQVGSYIVTTEMILFQLMDFAGTEEFKKISRLIK
jgi:isochorismate hydrolase